MVLPPSHLQVSRLSRPIHLQVMTRLPDTETACRTRFLILWLRLFQQSPPHKPRLEDASAL